MLSFGWSFVLAYKKTSRHSIHSQFIVALLDQAYTPFPSRTPNSHELQSAGSVFAVPRSPPVEALSNVRGSGRCVPIRPEGNRRQRRQVSTRTKPLVRVTPSPARGRTPRCGASGSPTAPYHQPLQRPAALFGAETANTPPWRTPPTNSRHSTRISFAPSHCGENSAASSTSRPRPWISPIDRLVDPGRYGLFHKPVKQICVPDRPYRILRRRRENQSSRQHD